MDTAGEQRLQSPEQPPAEEPAPAAIETRPLPRALDLRPESRARVLEGMRRVVEGAQGTAKDMRDELKALRAAYPEDTLAFYSKTGSPILEKSVPQAAGDALERLVVRGRLSWNGSSVVVDPEDRPAVVYASRGARGRDAYLQALHQALAEVGYRSSRWIRSTITGIVDDFLQDVHRVDPDELRAPLQLVDGSLRVDRDDLLFREERVKTKGGVYHFALVKLPGRDRTLPPTAEDLGDPDARVLAVAIHLEAGEGSEDAVDVAEALLPKLESLLR